MVTLSSEKAWQILIGIKIGMKPCSRTQVDDAGTGLTSTAGFETRQETKNFA